MKNILEQSNASLLCEVERLRVALGNASNSIPKELDKYYAWGLAACDELYQRVTQNIQYLQLGRDDIH